MVKPGDRFDKYEIVRELGRGGMGIVYEAKNPFGLRVVLKTLLPELAGHEQIRERFRREGLIQYTLRHPHIVRITDIVAHQGVPALVVDHMEGRDLDAAMDHGLRLTPAQVAELSIKVLDALQEAHEHGYIHRDLKPSNVFLEEKDGKTEPRLMDFGIAKMEEAQSLTAASEFYGTPNYASPEQIKSTRDVDARSDLYSWGVVMWHLLTGKLPYADVDDPLRIMVSVVREPMPPLPATVPDWLRRVVERALEKEPAARYQTAREFQAALREGRGSAAAAGVSASGLAGANVPVPLSGSDLPSVSDLGGDAPSFPFFDDRSALRSRAGSGLPPAAEHPTTGKKVVTALKSTASRLRSIWRKPEPTGSHSIFHADDASDEGAASPVPAEPGAPPRSGDPAPAAKPSARQAAGAPGAPSAPSPSTPAHRAQGTPASRPLEEGSGLFAIEHARQRIQQTSRGETRSRPSPVEARARREDRARARLKTALRGGLVMVSVSAGAAAWIWYAFVAPQSAPEGFARVEPGQFIMGSPDQEPGRSDEERLHRVHITRPFAISVHEVTHEEFERTMYRRPASFEQCGANCPITTVSWYDAAEYCNALSAVEGLERCYVITDEDRVPHVAWPRGLDCTGYRLPTEAEWEYAARAGASTGLPGGELAQVGRIPLDPGLDAVAWYGGNSHATFIGAADCSGVGEGFSRCGPQPVEGRAANALGLYDMLGNAAEWVWDLAGPYPEAPLTTDPTGPAEGSQRIVRGGSWTDPASSCRNGAREATSPPGRHGLGFRVVRTLR